MKRLHILGFILAGSVIVIERFGHPLPNWLAMALYGAAVLLIRSRAARSITTRKAVCYGKQCEKP